MKNTKRILAVVMSFLIMAVVPLNAFAAKLVDTIDLTVNVEPGTKMENYDDYVTINTPGVTLYDEVNVIVREIYEEESYYPATDYFEPGCVYELIIILDVTDGYIFADREDDFKSVTVNGEDAYIEPYFDESYEETGYYAVFTTVETDNSVNEIDLTVNPATGYIIDDYYRYVHINNLGVAFEEALDSGVKVTDAFGADPFDYFIAEEYILEICLTPAWGCEFTKDADGNISLDNVTVNGEAVEYATHIENDRGYIEYVTITLNVTPEEKTAITVIELTIEDDLKGYSVEDYEEYITIETDGVNFDIYDPYAVFAFDSDYEEVYEFNSGESYQLCMSFIAEEGYFLDPVGVVIMINGIEYAYLDYGTYNSDEGVTVEYVYVEYTTEYTGNFFDRIIAFFRNIFEDIGDFLFGWIYF